ncbi:hypothetical protein AB0F43_19655 [Kribbella sp. NPDC023972]|uniref:hypothetical protein n=1 Tax=Kribbella sp. NPDC023972 TaxID=3154795 RepID=UPI0033DFAC8E
MTAALVDVRAAAQVSHTPTSLEELLAHCAPEAVALSGAAQSAWNGQVVETSGDVLGLAHWDGTLYLDGDCILDPLRRMYELAGEEQPIPTLVRYRESLATILHEHAHFLGPADATQEAARGAFIQPGSRQLEEGVAEAWAQDNLNDFLTRLGVDKVAPGIKDVRGGGYYAAFVPAVRILTADLENRAGLQRGEVLNALNRETAEGQLPMVLSLLYNSTRLPELDSPDQSPAHRQQLESLLREGLCMLDTYELLPPGFAAARSRSTTGALLDRLYAELTAAEANHFPDAPACTLPAPAPPTNQTRLTPAHAHVTSAVTIARAAPKALHTAFSGVTPPTLIPTTTVASPARPHRTAATSQLLVRRPSQAEPPRWGQSSTGRCRVSRSWSTTVPGERVQSVVSTW